MEKYKIVRFVDGDFSINVKADEQNETVWLSQNEMATLFNVTNDSISLHIKNILSSGELTNSTVEISSVVQKEGNRTVSRKIKIYNLDMIMSIGYRVNSKRGIQFRKWANSVLKEYLIQGYAINERKMNALNKTIEIQNRMLSSTLQIDNDELVNVVKEYTKALDILDDYDHQCLKDVKGSKEIYVLTYEECRKIIDSMKFGATSNLFGKEKEEGKLNGILAAVYQNVFGEEVYKTLEDKASHLLYFLIKDHPFMDGCKRIAATLFLEFLNKNKVLVKNGKLRISNDALVAITLLIAESNPEEIDSIIKVVNNLLGQF
ncbi:MAG: virulence protein RhuM/Fic/DOC family protein [Bacilli bacterium]|nr:virulence protein RhuM/Fic/DOC family protein [Bacilli bacterium]